MKMLLITDCTDILMWYAKLVHQRVPFVREESGYYISREPAGYVNIVLKKDASIIEVADLVAGE